MTTQRHPLSWPHGWARTKSRKAAAFRSTQAGTRLSRPLELGDALDRLYGELRRLGVPMNGWVISSDLQVRQDGLPYASQKAPADPGVAVYFKLKGQDRVLACDTWTRIPDNIAAIAAHIECIRGIDRYGVGTLEQAFAGYAALPEKGTTWKTTLGFSHDARPTKAEIDKAFKDRARSAHPDAEDGSHDAMASLTEARTEGLKSATA